MSLHPEPFQPVPVETARVAHAAFPNGHPYLRLRDQLGPFFHDEQFRDLFPRRGQPAEAPWRLALVTLLQFAEGLSDRQAADALRARIDWKYLLGLELTDPGFHPTVLCEFRDRLLAGAAETRLFETLLACFREQKLLSARGRQRTDSTHVLAALRTLNRLESVGECFRHALNTLAIEAPTWLRAHCPPEWVARYGRPFDAYRLPKGAAAREALARTIGADGSALLTAIAAAAEAERLRAIPAVVLLRRVFVQQYLFEGSGLRFRRSEELPPAALRVLSPYDPEARCGKKGKTVWVGQKVHLTETCDAERPQLMTDVQTTPATTGDGEVTERIQAALQQRELLPALHLVDTQYADAHQRVVSRERYGIELVAPTHPDTRWQARAQEGFATSNFTLHWEERSALCPAGKKSVTWERMKDRNGQPLIRIGFDPRDCGSCKQRASCTQSQPPRRRIKVPEQPVFEEQQAARGREKTEAFAREYGKRAGVEGTLSQGVRGCGLRRCRYVGEAKTHLQHLLTAAGLNLLRVGHWLMGTPRARTRESAFIRLMASPA
jgi:transposase